MLVASSGLAAALTCEEEITRRTGLCVQERGLSNAAFCRGRAIAEVGKNCNVQSAPRDPPPEETRKSVPPREPAPTIGSVSRTPPARLLAAIPPKEIGRLFDQSRGLVEHFLNWSFKANRNAVIPISTRIQSALNEATELRRQDGMSVNPQLRNAEYYLHGLYASVSGDTSHLIKTHGAALYDELKAAVQGTPIEKLKLMRVDPENPNSPPGGAAWAYMGLKDGKGIRDVESGGRSDGFGLTLPSLHP